MAYEGASDGGNIKVALTVEEAATASAFSSRAIRDAAASGSLATRRYFDEFVIRVEDLDDWLSSLPTAAGRAEPKRSARPAFRTPEEVAPEIGVSKTSLRGYCRASGICTRGSRNKIMIHQDDIPRLVEWIKEHRRTQQEWWNTELDHFSDGARGRRGRQPDAFD